MPQIQYGTQFNANSVYVPGVYQTVVPPEPSPQGAVSAIAMNFGTASWGDVNSPALVSLPKTLTALYGGITAAALDDLHDLCTDGNIFLGQGSATVGNALYATRVTDGTDTKATGLLLDTAGATLLNITATKTGVKGNQVSTQAALGGPGPDMKLTLTGTTTTNDVVNIKFVSGSLINGTVNLAYAVVGGDSTLTLLATHLVTAINANSDLNAVNIKATSIGAVVTISWPQNLQAVNITTAINGTTTATVGGTLTIGDVLTITVFDAGLSGGSLAIPYTTATGNTTTDMATGLKNAINASSVLTAIGVTATSSAAIISIKSTSKNLTTYTKSITGGATETITFAAGPTEVSTNARVPSITLQVVPFPGGGSVETYAGLSGVPANFPAAALAAVNSGLNAARGPSNFIRFANPNPTVNLPVMGQVTLSGGTDGRNVTTSQLLGTNSAPASGIYSGQRLQFLPSGMWICGLTDAQAYPTIQQFCDSQGMAYGLTFDANVSTAAAVTAKNATGIVDYNAFFFKDWQYFLDTVNGQLRLLPPLPFAMGTITALAPWESPTQVGVKLSLGTERNNPYTGNQPYTYDELNSLGQAGIMLLDNDGGSVVFANGYNSVGNNDPTAYVEYTRVTNYIVQTNYKVLKKYLGKLAGFAPNDAVLTQMANDLTGFFENLKSSGYIAGYEVQINGANLPAHEVEVDEKVTYKPSIQTIFVQTQGGTTVRTANQGS